MNLVHLSNYSIDVSTIRLIEWNVLDKTVVNGDKKVFCAGTRISLFSHNVFLDVTDPNYHDDVARLREAVNK